MKKYFVAFCALFVALPLAVAASGETVVDTLSGEKAGGRYVVAPTETVTIATSLPEGTDARFVFKIPAFLSGGMAPELPGECSIIRRLDVPALIICLGVNGKMGFSYSGEVAETGNTKGFVAARGYLVDGTRWNHFTPLDFVVEEAAVTSPTPVPESEDGNESETDVEQSDEDEEAESTPTPAEIPEDVSALDNPNDIPTHARTLSDPDSKIILDDTEGNIIAVAHFDAQIEPVIIEKLTVELQGVNTAGLYGDTDNDIDMVNAVSLFYQNGDPVLKKDGFVAKTEAIGNNGKATLDNLNIAFPEGGERLYIAIETHEMLEGYSGAALKAEFSFDNDETTIRGFWSKNRFDEEILNGGDTKSPTVYIFANKIVAEESEGGTEFLKTGDNDVLPFRLNVIDDDEACLKEVTVNISTNSGGEGFRVTTLRLRRGADIIASRSGGDLTGSNRLVVGQCIGGDVCDADEDEGSPLFAETEFMIEAIVVPDDQDEGLEDANLSAQIVINSSTPGNDDIVWQDYGSDGDDGVDIDWIDLGSDSSLTRLERTISTP